LRRSVFVIRQAHNYVGQDGQSLHQAQDKRRLVEAMGIEPMSALLQTSSATCLAFIHTHSANLKTGLIQTSRFSDTNQATKPKNLA